MDNLFDGTENDHNGLEYLNDQRFKDISNQSQNINFLDFTSLIAFFGGRHVISEFYDSRQDIICHPLVKIIVLFSIIYMNMKNLKVSILIFFFYILFLDNYITSECNIEYIQPFQLAHHTQKESTK
jgi:hypothetical protein